MAKRGPKPKQFCLRNHDVTICGRNKSGGCNDCHKEDRRKKYIPHPKKIIRFCPRGHDTFIVGRGKSGRCKQCHRESRPHVEIDKRIKDICKYGHDKNIVGRLEDGTCVKCNEEYRKRYRKEIQLGRKIEHRNQFCVNNHDTFVCGRDKTGHCIECYINTQEQYYKDHKEEIDNYRKIYASEHPEAIAIYNRNWRKNHPESNRLSAIKQHEERSKRVVYWGQRGIVTFYKKCSSDMTVDHIIPLQGELVSGLHVRWNLQYLTRSDNSKKHNKCNLLEASIWYGKILEDAGLK